MEKSGSIVLTPDDLAEFRNGRVSQRIRDNWGLTLAELSAIIVAQEYTSTGETKHGSS